VCLAKEKLLSELEFPPFSGIAPFAVNMLLFIFVGNGAENLNMVFYYK
jgi:hypothetical protein